jgi:predicted GIY-YIG superfamily endonuclease
MISIYKLYCKDDNVKDCYIGSTSNIKRRISEHKRSCNNENSESYNQYKYTFIRENSGFKNWTYDIICECTSEDRYKMERWYIENTKDTNLNKCIPNRSRKEWREVNKEYAKQYNQLNKEKKLEIQKKWREKNKEKLKEFYQLNKEKIKDKNKNYQELNKAQISEQRNKKHNCECGGKYTNINKLRHFRSIKHQKFISSTEVVVKT